MLPDTRYATAVDGVRIAYQVLGDGPYDLVYSSGWLSNVDVHLEVPDLGEFLRDLARRARLITFDRRGTGVSDRPSAVETISLEKGTDDLLAVMDAVGSERALLFGFEDGCVPSLLFAASHPGRTLGLLLFAPWVSFRATPDFPWGWTEEEADEWDEHVRTEWGTEAFARWNLADAAPSTLRDPARVRAWTRYWRLCASPDAVEALNRMQREIDARAVLPAVRVPTLVMHRTGDLSEPVHAGRFVADRIPGGRFVELQGDDHPPFIGDTRPVLAELDRFAASILDQEAEFERVLATVLFTDIVGSTGRAAELGDRAWGELVERHHAIVRAFLARYRGTEVDTAGDGFFATFDGPARAVRCAEAIVHGIRPLGLEVRAGVHTGEVETIDGKTGGLAVVIGSRVAAAADASQILVSQTVRDLVAGSGLVFEDAGEHELKGVPDRWHLYRVAG
jgi:class 3 adenylate cyclase